MDPNVLKLERNKHYHLGSCLWRGCARCPGYSIIVLHFLLMLASYKAKITRLVVNKPEELLETFKE